MVAWHPTVKKVGSVLNKQTTDVADRSRHLRDAHKPVGVALSRAPAIRLPRMLSMRISCPEVDVNHTEAYHVRNEARALGVFMPGKALRTQRR